MNSLNNWTKASAQAKAYFFYHGGIVATLPDGRQEQPVKVNTLHPLCGKGGSSTPRRKPPLDRGGGASSRLPRSFSSNTRTGLYTRSCATSVITTRHGQLLPPSAGYVYNYKKIFSSFRSIITDQARRGQFEQKELETLTIKTILKGQRLYKNYNDGRGSFTTCKTCDNNPAAAYKPRSIIRLSKYEYRRMVGYARNGNNPAIKAYIKPRGTVTRVRNRCVITGRSSIIGSTGLSRICFRHRAGLGKIPGLLKI